jgi:hypothetical protein
MCKESDAEASLPGQGIKRSGELTSNEVAWAASVAEERNTEFLPLRGTEAEMPLSLMSFGERAATAA